MIKNQIDTVFLNTQYSLTGYHQHTSRIIEHLIQAECISLSQIVKENEINEKAD